MVREYHFFACAGQMDFRMWMACRIGIGVYLFRVLNIRFSKCSDGGNGVRDASTRHSPSMAQVSFSATSCCRVAGDEAEH